MSQKIKYIQEKLTTQQLAAQIVFPRIDTIKYYAAQDYQQNIHNLVQIGIGGFCVFSGAMGQVKSMITTLQSIAKTPLLFCADFEFGLTMRLENGTEIPHAMALGKVSTDYSFELAKVVAKESKSIGIDLILGPVCDVNNNLNNPIINIRSFGDNPEIVSKYSEQFIKGFKSEKVLSCAKHFPGHGDTNIDSHTELPSLDVSSERINELELQSFKNAIINDVDSIMIGHLSLPQIDESGLPATLSKIIISDVLIEELGFKGLIITDALEMKALVNNFSNEEIFEKAIAAGNDILLMPENPETVVQVIEDKINTDNQIQNRVNESVEKILLKKDASGLFYTNTSDYNEEIAVVDNAKLALKAALEAIQIDGDDKLLPLNSESQIAGFALLQNDEVEKPTMLFKYLAQAIENDCDFGFINSSISEEDLNALQFGVKNADTIILAYFFKPIAAKPLEVPEDLSDAALKLSEGKKIIKVYVGSPYIEDNVKSDLTIFTFSDSLPSVAASVLKLSGKNLNLE